MDTKEEKLYDLCRRFNEPVIIERVGRIERKERPEVILTEEEVTFVNSCLNDNDFDIYDKNLYLSYFSATLLSKNYQLAELIIRNNRFDFKEIQVDTLHSFCTFKKYDLLRLILKDERFDEDILNMQEEYNGKKTLLHCLCQNANDDNMDIIELVINSGKFTKLNAIDEYGHTSLFEVHTKSITAVKLITEHKNFDPNTLTFRTFEDGWSVLDMSTGHHEIFMYFLQLFEKHGLMNQFGVKQTMFNRCKYGMSVFTSLVGHDECYNSFCELIKFIEKHNMRDLVWPELMMVKLDYRGKKVFKLWKDYTLKPDETYKKIIDNTYDHDYDPNYLLDFPVEAISKVVRWHLWKER
ncbi:MAG: hypothetical protein Terrestrivirus15_4 [Terrestrivirus sp.]|uniref:Ankyrin repeat protein n=1 Tax=Terrestrivirus sp. TaxID=2487775 RepID=A0A3G4ZRY8_9VIRU|nr:MAG: hypothetical protein Terrestrivirus15_4 [Terrestrivirus sp.]